MTWFDWLQKVSQGATPTAIARHLQTQPSTVTRWRDGSSPSTEQASAAAHAYGRPVLEAFVAAGFLTDEEAGASPAVLSDLTTDELFEELRRRVS